MGPRGATGDTGAKGPTLVGPTGPAGLTGPAGAQGVVGDTGNQGSTTVGFAGSAGIAGDSGPQGPSGPTGARGPAGEIDRWISYRTFWFDVNSVDLRNSDSGQVSEIASYMQQNPSLNIGIDGSIPQGSNARNQDLANRRVGNVHLALINAGVPPSRISVGNFGDAQLVRDQRVEVLLHTGNFLSSGN
jgi:outer membrane protein OmpA-like peptidoglycan-associated protein